MLPLELALLTDPDLARQRRQAVAAHPEGPLLAPPVYFAAYLAAEPLIDRVRGDVDPAQVTVVVLATLFGLALIPSNDANAGMPSVAANASASARAAWSPRGHRNTRPGKITIVSSGVSTLVYHPGESSTPARALATDSA